MAQRWLRHFSSVFGTYLNDLSACQDQYFVSVYFLDHLLNPFAIIATDKVPDAVFRDSSDGFGPD